MKSVSNFAMLLAGVVLGIGVVVACGDDSPGGADAATCDCPAAEPPLTGRIVHVRTTSTIDPNMSGVAGAVCGSGGILLGGSCRLMESNANIYLNEAGIGNGAEQSYQCEWRSTSAMAATAIATAICLMPAQ